MVVLSPFSVETRSFPQAAGRLAEPKSSRESPSPAPRFLGFPQDSLSQANSGSLCVRRSCPVRLLACRWLAPCILISTYRAPSECYYLRYTVILHPLSASAALHLAWLGLLGRSFSSLLLTYCTYLPTGAPPHAALQSVNSTRPSTTSTDGSRPRVSGCDETQKYG